MPQSVQFTKQSAAEANLQRNCAHVATAVACGDSHARLAGIAGPTGLRANRRLSDGAIIFMQRHVIYRREGTDAMDVVSDLPRAVPWANGPAVFRQPAVANSGVAATADTSYHAMLHSKPSCTTLTRRDNIAWAHQAHRRDAHAPIAARATLGPFHHIFSTSSFFDWALWMRRR